MSFKRLTAVCLAGVSSLPHLDSCTGRNAQIHHLQWVIFTYAFFARPFIWYPLPRTQNELTKKFSCADIEGVDNDADFNVLNANSVSMALVSLAKNMRVESRRLKQLGKQYNAEAAAIEARGDIVSRLEYVM